MVVLPTFVAIKIAENLLAEQYSHKNNKLTGGTLVGLTSGKNHGKTLEDGMWGARQQVLLSNFVSDENWRNLLAEQYIHKVKPLVRGTLVGLTLVNLEEVGKNSERRRLE